MITNIPFQSCNEGKCDTCHDIKPLDTMVRKEYKKGLYECIDCKVDKENSRLLELGYIKGRNNNQTSVFAVEDNKLKKILSWCFG